MNSLYGNRTTPHDDPSNVKDSSVFTLNFESNWPLLQTVKSYYPIADPNAKDVNNSWLHDNIILVIVMGVVGFMVLATILYCTCCKKDKKGYANALYDDDDLKARI